MGPGVAFWLLCQAGSGICQIETSCWRGEQRVLVCLRGTVHMILGCGAKDSRYAFPGGRRSLLV